MSDKMKKAISQALIAKQKGEVPVGCAVYMNNELISLSHNTSMQDNDPTCHAEMLAIKDALRSVGRKNLRQCELYVTLEPCPMCAGAIIHSGVGKVYFGAYDKDFGAYDGFVNLFSHPYAKSIEVYGGIMENECSEILREFFRQLREGKFTDK